MKKLTKHESTKLTRKVYRWLAKNPGKKKNDYPYEDLSKYHLQCPCCEYARRYSLLIGDEFGQKVCERYCSLVWPKNASGNKCCHSGGLWDEWATTNDPKLALKISKLPERK